MKKWFEPLSTAWVGVAAVISLMSIGRGAEADIISRIKGLGSDLITINPGAVTFGGVKGAAGGATTLTLEDTAAISEQVPYIAAVAPSYSKSLQLVVGSKNMNASVTGVTSEYMQAYNLQTSYGAFISQYDYQRGAKVAVLGSSVKETLFEDADPIGQQMRMGNNIVRVIGVLESKGAMIGSPDNAILIPLTAMQQMVAQARTS